MRSTGCAIMVMFMLAFSSRACGMTIDDLADICEAMEFSITDVCVEYTWEVEPSRRTEDARGTDHPRTPKYAWKIQPSPKIESAGGMDYGTAIGPETRMWMATRPFGEKYLSSQKASVLGANGASFEITTMDARNSAVAKHLMSHTWLSGMGQGGESQGSVSRTSARAYPLGQTPLAFSILRLSVDHDGTALSGRLRKEGFVDFNEAGQKINECSAVCASLLIDAPTIPAAHKQPYLRVYFSTDHAYTPVRYEYLSPSRSGPRLDFIVDVNSLTEVAKGVWFPTSGSLVPADSNEVRNVYKASKVVVNIGLKEEDFTFEFPPGTQVHDEIAGVRYVVRPVSSQFDEWLQDDTWLEGDESSGQTDGAKRGKTGGEYTQEMMGSPQEAEASTDSGENTPASPDQRATDRQEVSKQGRSYVLAAIAATACILLFGVVAVRRILF